jgi:enamine deaminase RidA (YjgF/YER057c/UK114 family)
LLLAKAPSEAPFFRYATLRTIKVAPARRSSADAIGCQGEYCAQREERTAMEKSDVVVPRGQEILYSNFHFAPAVKDKDHLYCSGVIGMGPDGKAASDPETQFTQAFEGIKGVLEAAGLSFRDVVDITSFHVGLQANMRTFMKVKDRYVSEPYPAWTAIGITELAVPGGLVEVKVIARMRG